MVFDILKIAVLDDEQFVRDGLASLLASDTTAVVGSYYNGYHLLSDLNKNIVSPDIIIADIRMPDISGLEFIKCVRKSHPHIYLIILSGYGEFEYAKQAIENHVYRYLLKPLNESELFECLSSISAEISASSDQANWKEYSFELMFRNAISGQEIQKVPFREIPKSCRMFYFYTKERDSLRESLLELCERSEWNGRAFAVDENHLLFLVFSFVSDLPREIIKAIEDKCRDLYAYAGASGSYQSFSYISIMYGQAKQAVGYKLLSPKRLHYYSEIELGSMPVDHNRCNDLIKAICLANDKDVKVHAEKIASACKADPQLFVTFPYVSKLLKQYAGTLAEEFRNELYERTGMLVHFEYFESVKEYKDFFLDTVKLFCRSTQNSMEKDLGLKINTAISFIKANYNRELSLEEVSEKVSLSSNYFSHLFRKKTGIGFVDYVVDLRIQKAKDLLINTNSKVHEIGRMVGFKEPKYFIRTFSKLIGMSPMVYKKYSIQLNGLRKEE